MSTVDILRSLGVTPETCADICVRVRTLSSHEYRVLAALAAGASDEELYQAGNLGRMKLYDKSRVNAYLRGLARRSKLNLTREGFILHSDYRNVLQALYKIYIVHTQEGESLSKWNPSKEVLERLLAALCPPASVLAPEVKAHRKANSNARNNARSKERRAEKSARKRIHEQKRIRKQQVRDKNKAEKKAGELARVPVSVLISPPVKERHPYFTEEGTFTPEAVELTAVRLQAAELEGKISESQKTILNLLSSGVFAKMVIKQMAINSTRYRVDLFTLRREIEFLEVESMRIPGMRHAAAEFKNGRNFIAAWKRFQELQTAAVLE